MSDDLLAVEAGIADSETVARLRRCAHTIKGDSACIGLERLSSAAHSAEDYLDGTGGDASKLDEHVVGRLISVVDVIRGAVLNDWPTDLPPDLPLAQAGGGTRRDLESDLASKPFDQDSAAEPKIEGKRRKNVIRLDAAR